MDFGRQQLEKYGWTEGKGLGKNEDGIEKPVKAELKFDMVGLGYNKSEEFTNHWWEKVYNDAANNINVTSENGDVEIKTADEKPEKTIKAEPDKLVDNALECFSSMNLKKNDPLDTPAANKARLTAEGVIQLFDDVLEATRVGNAEGKRTGPLTDEELLAACGGRTAHKGARHGLTSKGKLRRVERLEQRENAIVAKLFPNLKLDVPSQDEPYEPDKPITSLRIVLQKKDQPDTVFELPVGHTCIHGEPTIAEDGTSSYTSCEDCYTCKKIKRLHLVPVDKSKEFKKIKEINLTRMVKDQESAKKVDKVKLTKATERFLEKLDIIERAYNKPKCEKCMHKRCRCTSNIFEKKTDSPKKRKVEGDDEPEEEEPEHVSESAKLLYELVRNSHAKKRKMGTSEDNVQQKKENPLKKTVNTLSDTLQGIKMEDQ